MSFSDLAQFLGMAGRFGAALAEPVWDSIFPVCPQRQLKWTLEARSRDRHNVTLTIKVIFQPNAAQLAQAGEGQDIMMELIVPDIVLKAVAETSVRLLIRTEDILSKIKSGIQEKAAPDITVQDVIVESMLINGVACQLGSWDWGGTTAGSDTAPPAMDVRVLDAPPPARGCTVCFHQRYSITFQTP